MMILMADFPARQDVAFLRPSCESQWR